MKLTPKGMRDIPPEEMFVREEAIETIRSIFRTYGYRPLETPAMEYLDTLRAKAGEEVDKQIFVIEGKEYGLRFDLTVPLARFAAGTDLPKPYKRYAIDVVWRKEEPQRGRFREFYQADVDIVGSASMRCEAEVLTLARDVCLAFGFTEPRILLNNRKILDAIAERTGLGRKKAEVFRILDKTDKVGLENVQGMLRDSIGQKADKLLEIIKAGGSNDDKLAIAARYSEEGAKELEDVLRLCDFPIEVDLKLVRGLGYYTGPVYEVKLSEGIGTVVAGGRYDGLLGIYGQEAPSVGISVGIERLITLINERKQAMKKTESIVFVAAIKPEQYLMASKAAARFRAEGIPAETDLNERNLRKQLDYINALSIPFAAIIGEKEAQAGKVNLRDMVMGTEELLSMEDAISRIRGR